MRSALTHILFVSPVRRFGLRLLVSLLALAIIYGGAVALYQHGRHRVSPSQKLAILRAGLDQTVLAGGHLAVFSDNNSIAGTTLSQEFNTYQVNVTNLQTKLSATPLNQLRSGQRRSAQAIIDLQNRAITSFKTAYKALAQPLSYDPYTDLGNLSISKDSSKLINRARAAQKGLTSNVSGTVAATSGSLAAQASQAPTNFATSQTQELLATSASCFGSLADQVMAKQDNASLTRQRCLQAYPALRAQIIHNILELSFSQQYFNDTQSAALPLLKQLDTKLGSK